MTVVYSDRTWYREEPSEESVFVGILERRTIPVGPGDRAGLHFSLVSARDTRIPVYAENVQQLLFDFMGTCVVVCGKKMKADNARYDAELWVGAIARAKGTTLPCGGATSRSGLSGEGGSASLR